MIRYDWHILFSMQQFSVVTRVHHDEGWGMRDQGRFSSKDSKRIRSWECAIGDPGSEVNQFNWVGLVAGRVPEFLSEMWLSISIIYMQAATFCHLSVPFTSYICCHSKIWRRWGQQRKAAGGPRPLAGSATDELVNSPGYPTTRRAVRYGTIEICWKWVNSECFYVRGIFSTDDHHYLAFRLYSIVF